MAGRYKRIMTTDRLLGSVIPLCILLLARPAPVGADRPATPLAGESPTAGVHLSAPSLVGGSDPSGLEVNPATTAFLEAWSLMVHHAGLKDDGRVGGAGDAVFLAFPAPLVRRIVLGVGLQWLRPAAALGYTDSAKLDLGIAWRVSPLLTVGLGYHAFFSDRDPALDHLQTVDLGLAVRPFEWLSAGLVVRDLFSPSYGGLPVQRVYDLELVARPLSSRRVELGLGVAMGERRQDFDPHVRLEVLPVSGLHLFAHLQLLTRDFYRTGSSQTDVRASVGFGFELERVGLALGTVAGRQMDRGPGPLLAEPARSAFQGLEATLRLNGQRQPPMVDVETMVVHLELEGTLSQREMVDLVGQVRLLEQRPDVRAVLVELDGLEGGWAEMQELRGLIQRLRRTGKKVYAFLREASQKEYYVAAAADLVLLDPAGAVRVQGMAMRSLYFRGTFDLLGVSPQFVRIAEFKSAPESFTEREASAPARAMMRSLFDDVLTQVLEDLARDRKKTPAAVRTLMDQGPYVPSRALRAGLVDELVEAGELKSMIEKRTASRLARPERLRRAPERWPVGPAVAVVLVEGDIVKGKSITVPLLDRRLVGDETVNEALRWARTSSTVKAVVLRVNSPGGSAWASDKMWREVARTREVKPVVVSMGDMAASGGYYVACAGDRVFAEPGTLTGSIGIFSGKFDVSGLMKKLGITEEIFAQEGKHASMESFARPYTAEERSFILDQIQYHYRRFLGAVSQGRRMTQDQVHAVARGRVWSGQQARAKGLVDATGGLAEAIEEARRRAGLGTERPVRIFVLPEEKQGLLSRALGLLSHDRAAAPSLPPSVREALRGVLPVLLRARSGEPLARVPYHLEF
jgi:protease-4